METFMTWMLFGVNVCEYCAWAVSQKSNRKSGKNRYSNDGVEPGVCAICM